MKPGSAKSESESLDPRIETARKAVVPLSAHAPEDGMTASLLGTERSGHAVLVREDGLLLTVGYLIAEAESVFVGTADGRMVPAFPIGYDTESGYGLVRALEPLNRPVVEFGSAKGLEVRDQVYVAESDAPAVAARIAAKQEFAGRWEYLLDEAIYTVPAISDWAGAALFDSEGKLCGIGSLLVHDGKSEEARAAANMFIPIDAIRPVLEEVAAHGRRKSPPRPWLGLLIHDGDDQLLIAGVYRNCPGDKAGIKPADIITEVDGEPVRALAEFFRKVWALGPAGTKIPLTVLRDGLTLRIVIDSAERTAFFKKGTIN